MQKLNITKEEFLVVLNNIRTQKRKNEKLNDALDDMCDGYVIFNSNDKYLESLMMVLNRIFYQPDDDTHNTIEWYLYEGTEDDNSHFMEMYGYELNIDTDEKLFELLQAEFEAYANNDDKPLEQLFHKYGTYVGEREMERYKVVTMSADEVMDKVKERYVEKLNGGEIL